MLGRCLPAKLCLTPFVLFPVFCLVLLAAVRDHVAATTLLQHVLAGFTAKDMQQTSRVAGCSWGPAAAGEGVPGVAHA